MNIDFSCLTWTKVWFEHTVSVLFDQETAGLGDDGGARMCIDVTQILFTHHCWGRARSSATVTSPGSRLPAAALVYEPLFSCWPWWAGGFIAYWKQPAGPEEKLFAFLFLIRGEQVRVKHNFVWEFRVHYLLGSGFVWIIPKGYDLVKLRTSCTKLQCVLLISCTVNLTSHFFTNFILFQVLKKKKKHTCSESGLLPTRPLFICRQLLIYYKEYLYHGN